MAADIVCMAHMGVIGVYISFFILLSTFMFVYF